MGHGVSAQLFQQGCCEPSSQQHDVVAPATSDHYFEPATVRPLASNTVPEVDVPASPPVPQPTSEHWIVALDGDGGREQKTFATELEAFACFAESRTPLKAVIHAVLREEGWQRTVVTEKLGGGRCGCCSNARGFLRYVREITDRRDARSFLLPGHPRDPAVNGYIRRTVTQQLDTGGGLERRLNESIRSLLLKRAAMLPDSVIPEKPVTIGGLTWEWSEPELVPTKLRQNADGVAISMDLEMVGQGCSVELAILHLGKLVLSKFRLRGSMTIVLKPVLPDPPFVGALQCYFINSPFFEFTVEHTGSLIKVPRALLTRQLRKVFEQKIAQMMVLPQRQVIPIVYNLHQQANVTLLRSPRPDGMLKVEILETEGLQRSKAMLQSFLPRGNKSSDPVVKILVGSEELVSTASKEFWICTFSAQQEVSVQVHDDNTFGSELIGDVQPQAITSLVSIVARSGGWLTLRMPEEARGRTGGEAGRVRLGVRYFQLTESEPSRHFAGSVVVVELHNTEPIHCALLDNVLVRVQVHGSPDVEGSDVEVATAESSVFRTHSGMVERQDPIRREREAITARARSAGMSELEIASLLDVPPHELPTDSAGGADTHYLHETVCCRLPGRISIDLLLARSNATKSEDSSAHAGKHPDGRGRSGENLGLAYSEVVLTFQLCDATSGDVLAATTPAELSQLLRNGGGGALQAYFTAGEEWRRRCSAASVDFAGVILGFNVQVCNLVRAVPNMRKSVDRTWVELREDSKPANSASRRASLPFRWLGLIKSGTGPQDISCAEAGL